MNSVCNNFLKVEAAGWKNTQALKQFMICCKYQDLEGWKSTQLSRYLACNVSLHVANMTVTEKIFKKTMVVLLNTCSFYNQCNYFATLAFSNYNRNTIFSCFIPFNTRYCLKSQHLYITLRPLENKHNNITMLNPWHKNTTVVYGT